MAQGDLVYFDQYNADVKKAVHDEDSDTFKYAFITDSVTPTAGMSDPRWGAGGGTNLSTTEVTPGGNYSAGGITLANPTVTLSSSSGVSDADDVSLAQDGSNPTDARWVIVYNDTSAGKECLAFIDLGSVRDLSDGPHNMIWNVLGLSSIAKAP